MKATQHRPSAKKETKITVLHLLKNFYDEQIFNILIKDFYDSDLDISVAAIQASGSLGNEVAIPHLYRIIEHGKEEQKIEATRTLAIVNAPSSIEKLVKYFNIFSSLPVRKEILLAINKISPFQPQVRELNKAVLSEPKKDPEIYEIVIRGLLEAGALDLIQSQIIKAPSNVQRAVFGHLLDSSIQEAADFISFFQEEVVQFDPHTLGCYLCAYEIKTGKPQVNFIIDTLQKSDRRATSSFIMSLSNYDGRIEFPTRLFRLLLRLPYVDSEIESYTGDFLIRVVEEVKVNSPLLMNEFIFTTATHLEAVFSKLKKQYISLKGVKERETLLIVILAKLLEQYATPDLLKDAQYYFRTKVKGNPDHLIKSMQERLVGASEDDQHRFKACLTLFMDHDAKVRLNTYHNLVKVDLSTHSLLRRLNRLIRVIGTLDIKNSGKKILEIVKFAREERIQFLEQTCIVTLCQLLNRTAIEQAKYIFADPAKHGASVNGYIRGARYIPPKIMINPLVKLLLNPGLNPYTQKLIVETLSEMNLNEVRGIFPALIRAIKFPEISDTLKEEIGGILSNHGDTTLFQQILDLTHSENPIIKQIGVRILNDLAAKGKNIATDVVTNRLYLLLEDAEKTVQIESLLALLTLRDDYANQILEDYISANDEIAVVEILRNLDEKASHEVFSLILGLFTSSSSLIHKELRQILPNFCQGNFSEEIRKSLLDALKETGDAPTRSAKDLKEVAQSETGLIEHAKLEFKFRREHSQVLTVFFIDIVSYTEKSSRADTTSLMKLIQAFEEITLPTIARLKGTLIKKMGDGLLATFKHPLNAAITALTVQKEITEYNQYKMDEEKFNVRIGLNTGPVIRKDTDIYGDTVNVASRMETSASPGDILLTQNTYDEIKEYVRCTRLGDIQVKGKSEAITSYSAEEITVDISKILGESSTASSPEEDSGNSLARLKESVFTPQFTITKETGMGPTREKKLEMMFLELTEAIEAISKDYQDEYVFKRFLQDTWNSVMTSDQNNSGNTTPL